MGAAEAVDPMFVVREGRASDHALVFSSWLGSDRFSRAGQAAARVYKAEHERVVRAILERPTTNLRVACLPDDEDALLAWSVTNDALGVVFYVYVKRGVRGNGIARALLGDLLTRPCEFTHQAVVQRKDLRPPQGWTFNPYRNFR